MILSRLLSSAPGTPEAVQALGLVYGVAHIGLTVWQVAMTRQFDAMAFTDAAKNLLYGFAVAMAGQGLQRRIQGDKPVEPCQPACPPRQEAASTP